jgi:hypothetical protein
LLRPSRRFEFSRKGASRLRPYSGYGFLGPAGESLQRELLP